MSTSSPENSKERIARVAHDIKTKSSSFAWQVKELIRALPLLLDSRIRRGAGNIIRGYVYDYREAQNVASKNIFSVEQPIDTRIPYAPGAISTYLGFVGLWIAGINAIKSEFGNRAIDELARFIEDMAEFYSEAGQIFRTVQTSFPRTGTPTFGVQILRMWDKNTNAAPSLHAEVAAHTFSRLSDIIRGHATNAKDYTPLLEILHLKTVEVLESVLLIKQHGVLDVALGLALVTAHDPQFSSDRAQQMIENLFEKNTYGMPEAVITEVRSTLREFYEEAAAQIRANIKKPQEIIIECLSALPLASSDEKSS